MSFQVGDYVLAIPNVDIGEVTQNVSSGICRLKFADGSERNFEISELRRLPVTKIRCPVGSFYYVVTTEMQNGVHVIVDRIAYTKLNQRIV